MDEAAKVGLSQIMEVLECQHKEAGFYFIGTPIHKTTTKLYDIISFVL